MTRASEAKTTSATGKNLMKECIKITFEVNNRLKFHFMTYDLMHESIGEPKMGKTSYAYRPSVELYCLRYCNFNFDLIWNDKEVTFQNGMTQELIN